MVDLSQLQKVQTEQDIKKDTDRAEAKQYLRDTDWYVTRFVEIGEPVPAEITAARAAARVTLRE